MTGFTVFVGEILFTLATEILVMKTRFLNVVDTVKILVTSFGFWYPTKNLDSRISRTK